MAPRNINTNVLISVKLHCMLSSMPSQHNPSHPTHQRFFYLIILQLLPTIRLNLGRTKHLGISKFISVSVAFYYEFWIFCTIVPFSVIFRGTFYWQHLIFLALQNRWCAILRSHPSTPALLKLFSSVRGNKIRL